MQFFAAAGCDKCGGTGYRGRLAIHEILVPDDAFFHAAVTADVTATALRRAALAAGMRPMLIAGLEAAAYGITSLDELVRVAPVEE